MEFRIYSQYNASEAKGTVVVIDVLRACTTLCYLFSRGVKTVFPVVEVEDAWILKKQLPDAQLVGERHGLPIEGFDFCNSPAQLKNAVMTDKIVIMTTTSGTKGIVAALTRADQVITGSFVNAAAVAAYIIRTHPSIVSFISTDNCTFDNEDYLCASYIRSILEGNPRDFSAMKKYISDAPHSDGFLRKPLTPNAAEDFSLCLTPNVFPFVIKAQRTKSAVQLIKTDEPPV